MSELVSNILGDPLVDELEEIRVVYKALQLARVVGEAIEDEHDFLHDFIQDSAHLAHEEIVKPLLQLVSVQLAKIHRGQRHQAFSHLAEFLEALLVLQQMELAAGLFCSCLLKNLREALQGFKIVICDELPELLLVEGGLYSCEVHHQFLQVVQVVPMVAIEFAILHPQLLQVRGDRVMGVVHGGVHHRRFGPVNS